MKIRILEVQGAGAPGEFANFEIRVDLSMQSNMGGILKENEGSWRSRGLAHQANS